MGAKHHQLLTVALGRELVDYRWRTAREGELRPRDMRTTHLFYTLRMLWNNFMPAEARVGRVRLYRFDPGKYPPYYLAESVVAIFLELSKRADLPSELHDELRQMAEWFGHNFSDVDEARLPQAQRRLA